jgi:K+-sensing histidine kinase KdpD
MATTGQSLAVVTALSAPSVIAQAAHVEVPVTYLVTLAAGGLFAVLAYFVKREVEDTREKRRIDRAKLEGFSDTLNDLKTKLAVIESRLANIEKE